MSNPHDDTVAPNAPSSADVDRPQRDYGRLFAIGLLLLVASWGVKQLLLSVATWGLGGALEEVSIELDREAALADKTRDQQVALAEERAKDDPNYDKMSELEAEIDKERTAVSKEYAPLAAEARADAAANGSTGLWFTRLFLRAKLPLDLVKILGMLLLVWGALGLARDERAPNHQRWFAIGSACVVLAATLVWGLLSYLS